jgi:hypothetical protein
LPSITLERFIPPPRYAVPPATVARPYTLARIEASASIAGPWDVRGDVRTLTPVDVDPEDPQPRSFTVDGALPTDVWWRVTFIDALGDESLPTDPVAIVPWTASVQDVADVSPAFTRRRVEAGGRVGGSFDETTDPTADTVRGFIAAGVREVQGRVGVTIMPEQYELAREAVKWHAAAAVEAEHSRTGADDVDGAVRWKVGSYVACLNELTTQARRRPLRLA